MQSENKSCKLFYYVQACRYANVKNIEEAVKSFEKAVPLDYFTRRDIESEKMLKNISKNERYRNVIDKYYPAN